MKVKKEISKFCNKLFIKVNLNYKSHIHKIITLTKTSTNSDLKVFIRFQIKNWYTQKCHVLENVKRKTDEQFS